MNHILKTSPFVSVIPNTSSKELSLYNALTKKIYPLESKLADILKLTSGGISFDELTHQFDEKTIRILMENQVLLELDEIWNTFVIENLEIEISTWCNWSCEYCPNSIEPKEKKVMSMDLFNSILDKAEELNTVKIISLNAYNEPTLDPHFEERILSIAKKGFKLVLHTNGTALSKRYIQLFTESTVLSKIIFNLPSIENDEFKRLTKANNLEKVLRTIDKCIKGGLDVDFSINGTKEEIIKNIPSIIEKYEGVISNKILAGHTQDRVGTLVNRYSQNIDLRGTLYGCEKILNWIHINVEGDLFICSHDFHQKHTYGNIQGKSFREILLGDESRKIRKYVFGENKAPDNFLCRKCHEMKRARLTFDFTKRFKIFEVNRKEDTK